MDRRVIVKVYIFDENDNVLIIRRSKTDPRRPLQWDIPGGHIDDGESIEVALIRETQEEVGINLRHAKPVLASTHTKIAREGLLVNWLFFVVKLPGAPVVTIGEEEHDIYEWLPLTEAINAIEYDLQKNTLKFIADNKLYKP